jgi:flagellar biosynthesis GTPase FlhF
MDIVPFIAESAADAARQVRERLGPDAVVVQVRPVNASTRSWFGKKPRTRFEVLAYRPDAKSAPGPAPASPPRERLDLVAGDDPSTSTPPASDASNSRSPAKATAPYGYGRPAAASDPIDAAPSVRSGGGGWRAGSLLESAGILPHEAQRVVDRLRKEHGDQPPAAMAEELALVKRVLKEGWRSARPMLPAGGETHVLVGAPGVGKTTSLSKWLTQVALGEGRPVRVWRLDGQTANTAEALAVYCDVLGVPLARRWCDGDGADPGESGFVDLPGTDWRDAGALSKLAEQVQGLGSVRVHLVLNGAYDMMLMMRQVRAFSALPIEDLIVTHLDEEPRWGKLWNLVGGTNYSVRFLGAGQNVPGEFRLATADQLLMRQFPTEYAIAAPREA